MENYSDTGLDPIPPVLVGLVKVITPRAKMDDLAVPGEVKRRLREIIKHVKGRHGVYGRWGIGGGDVDLGISVLFLGEDGVGKTMAAEVLARELKMSLYRIDLSMVVSKYVGETEKNLDRIFDAADSRDAVLFFDEADALFGKRSDVRDSHDRYANIEVSYLLERMESYAGLAILASNMKEALDPTFVRRIRFVIEFPVPDDERRE